MEQNSSHKPRQLSGNEVIEVLTNLGRDQKQAVYQVIGELLNNAESRLTAEASKPAPSAEVFAVIAGEKKALGMITQKLYPSEYQQNKLRGEDSG